MDNEWINGISRKPAAQPLLRFLAACNVLASNGRMHMTEPPVQQAAVWRRILCHAYKTSDTPLGMRSPSGKMPRVVAVVNLAGHQAMYHCESFSLARVLASTCQEASQRVSNCIEEVIEQAEKSNASILLTFILPFAETMDRVYWELRTIRKTQKGVVKDGEKACSISDTCARTTSCTSAIETWPDAMLTDLGKKLLNVCGPSSLDLSEHTEVTTPPEKLHAALEMLKTERKRTQEEHAAEKKQLAAGYEKTISAVEARVAQIQADADSRVSEVLRHAEAARDVQSKKNCTLEEHNATLMNQLTSTKLLAAENSSRLHATALEHEQDVGKFKAREKALQAQLTALQVQQKRLHDKDQEERNAMRCEHKEQLEMLNKQLRAACNESLTARTTLEAEKTATKEAHKRTAAAEHNLKAFSTQHDRERNRSRVFLALLHLCSVRNQSKPPVDDQASQLNACNAAKMPTVVACVAEKKHASEDTTASLQNTVSAQASAIRKLQKQLSGMHDSRHPQQPHDQRKSTKAIQNTSVFMPQQTYNPQSAFPQGNFNFPMDPALEAMISHMHSALATITATARASNGHRKALDAANAKLELFHSWGYSAEPYYQPPHPM